MVSILIYTSQPYFTAFPAQGVPPFGPGLRPSTNLISSTRDALMGKIIFSKIGQCALPQINAVRTRPGLMPLGSYVEMLERPPRVFYFTVDELEYPRDRWLESFRLVLPTR